MSRCGFVVVAALALVTVPGAGAQEAPSTPTRGPQHQKLSYFAGNWTSQGEMKVGPFGAGGPMSGTAICEWFEGGFHLLCRSQGEGPMGAMYGLGILGYNQAAKRYTYYGIDNTGAGDPAYGQVSGDTWTWEGEGVVSGQKMKSRYTMKQLGADRYSWRWELSGSTGVWTLIAEGIDTRVPQE